MTGRVTPAGFLFVYLNKQIAEITLSDRYKKVFSDSREAIPRQKYKIV